MSRLLLLVALAGCLYGQDHSYEAGERLLYSAGFRLFAVGTTTMEVTSHDTAGRPDLLHLLSRTDTEPFFDRIYRIRDRIDIWLDKSTLELRRMERDIREGRFRRADTTTVDPIRSIIITRRDTLKVAGPVFDPVGAIYYLRGLTLAVGDEITLNIYDGRRLKRVAIRVWGEETISVPAGEFQCLVLRPVPLDDKRLTKVDGLMHLWLANDEVHTPVRLEQQTRFGTLRMSLIRAD